MNRERATRIIRRIVQTIEANQTPAVVRELYVFGSYVRGATMPNDLDVIIIHDPPPSELIESFKRRADELNLDFTQALFYPAKRFDGTLRKSLCKPGEAVDLLMGQSLKAVMETYSVLRDDKCVLLWSLHDRDVETKLASLMSDPDAGRAERPGFMTAKEAGCSAAEMRQVATLLKRDMLVLKRWPLADKPPELRSPLREMCERWIAGRSMGVKSLQCLPFAFN